MANRTSQNPIVIDTTDTLVSGPLQIQAIKWVGTQNSNKDIANGDDLTIRVPDSSGNKLIEIRAGITAEYTHQEGYTVYFPKGLNLPGLYVEDLDGGELQIFLI